MPTVPQLAFPFSVVEGKVREVEQDSSVDITQCVEACLRTLVGSRIEVPSYGIFDETFIQLEPNPSPEIYLNAVAAVEPRAHLLAEAEIEDMTERIVIRP